jgi:hypothetical protein
MESVMMSLKAGCHLPRALLVLTMMAALGENRWLISKLDEELSMMMMSDCWHWSLHLMTTTIMSVVVQYYHAQVMAMIPQIDYQHHDDQHLLT